MRSGDSETAALQVMWTHVQVSWDYLSNSLVPWRLAVSQAPLKHALHHALHYLKCLNNLEMGINIYNVNYKYNYKYTIIYYNRSFLLEEKFKSAHTWFFSLATTTNYLITIDKVIYRREWQFSNDLFWKVGFMWHIFVSHGFRSDITSL